MLKKIRWLLVFLTAAVIWCACAAADTPVEEFAYTVNGNTVSITRYLGTHPVVEVPAMIEGKPVVSVKLGYTDEEIGEDSFTGLVSVTLPETVTELSDYAFARCFNLYQINGLEHITHVGCNAFNGATIRKLTFSENLILLGESCFLNSSVKELTIPDNVLTCSFTWDGNPDSLQAPNSRMLGAQELQEIHLIKTGSAPTLQVIDHCVYSADGTVLLNVLTSYTDFFFRIPDGVTGVGSYAFSHAQQVEVAELPQSAVDLWDSSFSLSYLHTIYVQPGSAAESTAESWAGGIPVVTVGTDGESLQRIIQNIVAAETSSGMTDWQKAYALHNWLCVNVTYDETYERRDATAVFLEGKGVCDAFAKAYCALLSAAGIESKRVECQMSGVGHAINAVRINGCWFYVDCTNDTPGALGAPNRLFGFDHLLFEAFYGGSTIVTADTCAYYAPYVLGELDADLDALAGYIQNRLDAGETAFDFDPLSVLVSAYDLRTIPLSSLLSERVWTVSGTEIPFSCACHDGRLWITTAQHSPYEYESYEDGICLTAYSGKDTVVSVPSVYDGKTVLATRGTFVGNEDITRVILPETLVSLGESTFAKCTWLESVELPSSLKSIGDTAFWQCIMLQGGLTIPQGVTAIGASAFTGCSSLETVYVPGTVKTIDEYAFFDCSSLSGVTLGEGVESILHDAFYDCLSLRSIRLPDTLKKIQYCAFVKTGLESLHIPASTESIDPRFLENSTHFAQLTVSEDNPYFSTAGGMLLSKDGKRLIAGTAAVSADLRIPDGVEVIGNNAFVYNLSVRKLHIPSSVRTVERYAFYDCQRLEELYMEDGCETIGECAFGFPGNSGELKTPHLASTITSIGKDAFRSSVSLRYLVLPAALTSLPHSIVNLDCAIYIPEGMRQMTRQTDGTEVYGKKGTYAETYAAENGYVFVENNAGDPDWFNTDYIYETWEDGIRVFYTYLTGSEITIPAVINGRTVRSIGGYYLFYQSEYTKINLPEGLKDIGEGTFMYCAQLRDINIPSTVKTVGRSAFAGSGLTAIVLPTGLESVGEEAFCWCYSLKDAWIPASVTAIGMNCFGGCPVTIHSSSGSFAMTYAETYNISAVADMPAGPVLYLPDSLVRIEEGAFINTAAEVVVVPSSIIWIAEGAFDQDITFVLPPDSPLAEWCDEHGYARFEPNT